LAALERANSEITNYELRNGELGEATGRLGDRVIGGFARGRLCERRESERVNG